VTPANRRQLGILVLFAGVMLAPVPWAVPAFIGAAVGLTVFRAARYLGRRASP
jgi:hypothetical protein